MEIFIFTEGGRNIGFGHITRMLSIYQAFEEKNVKPELIIKGDESITNLVKGTNFRIYDWIKNKKETLELVKEADIVIIDSYLAPESLYKDISKIVKIPVYYDDNKRIDYPCGFIINGNPYAPTLNYDKKICKKYLLGIKYLPLRKEFWDVPPKKINKEIKSIMLTFGGEDIRNLSPKILKTVIEHLPYIKKYVIIGKSFSTENINKIKNIADTNTEIVMSPNANEMKNIILKADIAISAGGQTTYELLRIGTSAITISVAKNQICNQRFLKKENLILFAGTWKSKFLERNIIKHLHKLKDYPLRKSLSQKTRSLIDGKGCKNIVEVLLKNAKNYISYEQ